MPAPSLSQIVSHGAAVIRGLVEIGADPLGLAGATDSGEPVIAIAAPPPDIARTLRPDRLWKVELAGRVVEEVFIARWRGCYVRWTVTHPIVLH